MGWDEWFEERRGGRPRGGGGDTVGELGVEPGEGL